MQPFPSSSREKLQQPPQRIPSSAFYRSQPQPYQSGCQVSGSHNVAPPGHLNGASGSCVAAPSYSTPRPAPPPARHPTALAPPQAPQVVTPLKASAATTRAGQKGRGGNETSSPQSQASAGEQAQPALGSVVGSHILKDGTTFKIAVGETYPGRQILQKKIQEIALRNNFRVNVGTSSMVNSVGPCPVNGHFSLVCHLKKRNPTPNNAKHVNCPFSIRFWFVLEKNGTKEDDLVYKMTSIVDEHNHPLPPLSDRQLQYAVTSITTKRIWLGNKVLRSSSEEEDELSSSEELEKESEEEEVHLRPASSRRKPRPSSTATTSTARGEDFATVDWIPPAEWRQALTRDAILDSFPKAALKATGIEVVGSYSLSDLTFVCKLRKEVQCDWKVVFGPVHDSGRPESVQYQLLGAGPKRTFTHSHPIEEQESLSTSESSSRGSTGKPRRIQIGREVKVPELSSPDAAQPAPADITDRDRAEQAPIAPRSPSSISRAGKFAESGTPEDVKPTLVKSSKRARSVSLGAAASTASSINLGYMVLEDSDDEPEQGQANDVKPDLKAISEERRPAKQARLAGGATLGRAAASSSTRTPSQSGRNPASTPALTPIRSLTSSTVADTSTAQAELETFLLSIDPEFIVLTSTGQKLNLNFLAPLLLADDHLPNTIEELSCLQIQDAQLLAKPLQEAYEKGGEGSGKIKGFNWIRIVNRLEGWLREK
ncbi:hypothetical protein JCM3765_001640 [Sporobolomyces pararoseus]